MSHPGQMRGIEAYQEDNRLRFELALLARGRELARKARARARRNKRVYVQGEPLIYEELLDGV